MGHDTNLETIIKQHRRWTLWIEDNRTMGEGSLVLTNRRLLFLNRIESSPEVTASIRELADAPVEKVLDHALTLHKNCFQMLLSSIMRVEIISLFGFPFPRFRLSIIFLKGKKLTPHTAEFTFRTYGSGMLTQPQIIADWGWKSAIKKAIQKTGR
ncbi:MAG: hypothetical protein JW901_07875 [Dehalococcoidia bacterium]|nr:hypothetical protein [Dehalococcoidia bacterium]